MVAKVLSWLLGLIGYSSCLLWGFRSANKMFCLVVGRLLGCSIGLLDLRWF